MSRVRLFAITGLAMLLWTLPMSRRADAQTPQYTLSGGKLITTCIAGSCVTNRYYCVTSQLPEFIISVTNAAPNSTVQLQRYKFQNGIYTLVYSANLGSTNGSGQFQYSTTPGPPSSTGSYSSLVKVNGQFSNSRTYILSSGSNVCG